MALFGSSSSGGYSQAVDWGTRHLVLEDLLPSSLTWALAGLGSSQAVGRRTTWASP